MILKIPIQRRVLTEKTTITYNNVELFFEEELSGCNIFHSNQFNNTYFYVQNLEVIFEIQFHKNSLNFLCNPIKADRCFFAKQNAVIHQHIMRMFTKYISPNIQECDFGCSFNSISTFPHVKKCATKIQVI